MHSRLDTKRKTSPDAQAILETITDAFVSLNPAWEFTYVNPQAGKVLDRNPDDLLGKIVWNEYPGLVGSEFEALYRRAARDRTAGSITSFFPDHGRWYEVQVYAADIGISVYFRDVTERVQTDEKLRESELRFRLMADSIPQIVWIADASGRAAFFNKQWSIYTGIPAGPMAAEEVVASFIHPDDAALTLQEWEAARREGRVFSVEHRIRSVSGEYRWFLVRAEPDRDPRTGEIARWFGTSTDVHDRKLSETALKKSEERYRSLFESIDEGFCIIEMIFDRNGDPCDYRFSEINPMFEQQAGLRAAVGKTMLELAPQHEKHWFEIYGKVAVTGEPIRFENEARALGRWFDVYAFRIDEPSAHKVAILFKDITERRRVERDLQLADRRKDEFLAMLAHELRNPLAPIGAAADLLRLARLDDARIRQTSEIISRQVKHMTSLVDDLLDVSRVTRGLITLDMVTLDIKRIVSDAVEQSRPLIEARRHRFAVYLPPESAFVLGDPKRLVQVIANLLNNAAKYTPEGGDIALKIEVQDAHVMLAVSDTGIGMAPELLNHVFDLFAQAERTSDRSQGGLGIGLALVKSLIGLHHGSVTAHSAGPGQGSKFIVCLPRVAKPDNMPGLWEGSSVAASPRHLRIMIVEDNTDAARMLALFLEAAGHQVMVEHDSAKAMERARLAKPDVFLLDIGLPGINGYELARRLRSQPETARSLLIAVTGYGQEKSRKNSLLAGFDHHFVKPVDSARLVALLAEGGPSEER